MMRKLSSTEIIFLKEKFKTFKVSQTFHLHYEKQVPNSAIIFLTGKLELMLKNRVEGNVEFGSILGPSELLSHKPLRYGLKVCEGSELILLQKSDLKELIEDPENLLQI